MTPAMWFLVGFVLLGIVLGWLLGCEATEVRISVAYTLGRMSGLRREIAAHNPYKKGLRRYWWEQGWLSKAERTQGEVTILNGEKR